MRRRITWRSAAAIAMLGLAPAGIGAAFAAPAGASTSECAAALGTQCGTFTESAYKAGGNSGGLGWDVKGQSSAADTPLIEYKNYSPGNDPGTDLTKVEHYGTIPGSPSSASGTWYSIVYTPSGQWTSMCVSNPDNKGMGGTNLVLRSCNQQKWQAFLAVTPTGSPLRLPAKPTAPSWTGVVPIPNASSTGTPYALYSAANGRFVEVSRPRMSAADTGPRPQPRALSATGRTGEKVTVTSGGTVTTKNAWYWTNATGTP